MADKIETIEGALVQHGRHNDRIYVMHLGTAAVGGLIAALNKLAAEKGYGKIFAKIPAEAGAAFRSAGYTTEAVVPRLFNGKSDGLFMAKYPVPERRRPAVPGAVDPYEGGPRAPRRTGTDSRPAEACRTADADEMAVLYRQVFESYPFPIQNPSFLRDAMKRGVRYGCIRVDGTIAALAAAEIDAANRNCEMTDFATLPRWRGRGLARILLDYMENKTRGQGIKTAFTIARAASPGMNFVFKNNGYRYGGLLISNSHISGSIQSMVVRYKHL